jgi:hypothetical protein
VSHHRWLNPVLERCARIRRFTGRGLLTYRDAYQAVTEIARQENGGWGTPGWSSGAASFALEFLCHHQRLERIPGDNGERCYRILDSTPVSTQEWEEFRENVTAGADNVVLAVVEIEDRENENGYLQSGTLARCTRTGHETWSWGTSEKSEQRCLIHLRQECACESLHLKAKD